MMLKAGDRVINREEITGTVTRIICIDTQQWGAFIFADVALDSDPQQHICSGVENWSVIKDK